MFRRHWCGLPKDASFPSDLKRLGYFINEEDEIRSSDSPDSYFKYFLNRNARINQRQRFAFDYALEKVIYERLEDEGLQKTPLPLGTSPSQKHVPIFMDANLETKSRVVVVFGETDKALGILAGRVAGGRGGINKGSMVSVVKELRTQRSTATDAAPPGIVLANVGQLYWWPDEKRALTVSTSSAIPLPSLVHAGRKYHKELNEIEQNETPAMHIQYVFNEVLAKTVGEKAVIDVVALGNTCDTIEEFLDNEKAWNTWGHRLSSVLLMDTICEATKLTNSSFKDFLAKRARCYLRCPDPVDTPLSPPAGNESLYIAPLGMPCYSSSEPNYIECILIKALHPALSYLERNALSPEAENEIIIIIPKPQMDEGEQEGEGQNALELTDEDWGKVDDAAKPGLDIVDPGVIEKERKHLQMWKQFEETSEAPHPNVGVEARADMEAVLEPEKAEFTANSTDGSG